MAKIVLHGILKDRYQAFEVGGDTAAEVLEGWSRQAGMDPSLVVEVVGFETEEALRAPLVASELHLVPAMFGGGGGFGKVLLGAVSIGLSFIPGIGQIAAIALRMIGTALVLQGVTQIFMKQPTVDKDPDASRYIGTGRNSTAIGTPMGIGGGRILIGGQFLSVQVNSSDLAYGSFPSNPA